MKTGFYNLSKLSKAKRIAFLKDAVILSFNVHLDVIDCDVSWSRNRCENKSILEIINTIHSSNPSLVVIDRTIQDPDRIEYEVGLRTMTGVIDYFIFCSLNKENFTALINKYDLKQKE
jgi:hypothetical protein